VRIARVRPSCSTRAARRLRWRPCPLAIPISTAPDGLPRTGCRPGPRAHRIFHRILLEGCGNPVLLETFDRMSTASEPARDADTAAGVLSQHLTLTAAGPTGCTDHRPVKEA
jgi:hypothetical protein